VFDGATEREIKKALTEANLATSGKTLCTTDMTGTQFRAGR